MQKVCFIIFNLEPGGLQVNLLRFIKDSNTSLNITIIVKGNRNNPLQNDFIKAGANVIHIKSGYFNVFGWYNYFRIFKSGDWTSVCDLTGNFAGIYMLLSHLAGIPNRVAYYGQTSNHYRPGVLKERYNWVMNILVKKFSTSIISNSPQALDFFIGRDWHQIEKVQVISNGVSFTNDECQTTYNIRSELKIPEDAKIILNASRYDKNKNQNTVLKVAEIICSERSDIFFIFCGKGTEALKIEINRMGLQNRVFALGYRTNIVSILKSSNVFYFPSLSEGQPNALIEAIICGLPFVASDIPEIKEIIPEPFRLQLIPPKNIEVATNKILEIVNGVIGYDTEGLKIIIEDNFNPIKRFQEFRQSLTRYHVSKSK